MTDTMNPVTFHIGLHKTGTTFLQQNVFPVIKGKHRYVYHKPSGELFNSDEEAQTIVSCEWLSGDPFRRAWADQGKTYVRNTTQMPPEASALSTSK